MKIMVNYPNKSTEAAGSTETAFLLEFQTACEAVGHEARLVGAGMPDHVPGWGMNDYMRNYFRGDPDWILGYYHLFPDWLTRPAPKPRLEGFTGRIAEWSYDLHVDPLGIVAEANEKIDLWLPRCTDAYRLFPTLEHWTGCKGANIHEWLRNGSVVEVAPDYFMKHLTTQHMLFPLSYNPQFYKPLVEKDYDLAMIGIVTPYYPLRTAIYAEIEAFARKNALRLLLHPSPPNEYTANIDHLLQSAVLRKQYSVGPDYAERVAKSKMFVFCSGFAKAPIGKYLEGMMAGTAVVADKPANASELHLEPDKNFIEITETTWKEKVKYYLDDTTGRAEIARRGRETAEKYHTNEVRANELLAKLKSIQRND